MPSLADHQSNTTTKLLLLGDAKSGKTGSLVSLVAAGYKLRILDLDNLLDILKYKILDECPTLIDNVEFRTIRDRYKPGADGTTVIDGKPKAWVDCIKMLDHWKYDDVDLGKPAQWGEDVILVIDSLSRLCDAAYDFHESIIPKGRSGDYDGRAVYGNAQDDVEKVLAMLTSKGFATNLIVIPQGVGQKLSPKIPQYFPSYVRYKNVGGKRVIQLNSDPMIDLANPRPDAFKDKTLPIETGLAEFFAALKGQPAKTEAAPRPKSLTLRKV
jgi:hypothetical protein